MKRLTHNEIKEALAVKYQKACTVREKFRAATQRLLDEGGAIAEIMCYTEASIHANQSIDGLLLAAIALDQQGRTGQRSKSRWNWRQEGKHMRTIISLFITVFGVSFAIIYKLI